MPEKIAEDAFQVRQNIVIPIANDHNAFLTEPVRAAIVGQLRLFGVLPAVDFDRQAEARAIEVDRERSDWMLPPELKTIELITAKRTPQSRFSVGHVAAENSGPGGESSCAEKA
jgi:hypothetical protein